jgi:hypothetical protein
MFKYVVLLGALAFAAPAVADNNKPPPFPGDPPASDFNSNSKGRPAGFPPVPGCTNGVATGNPHCRPASNE